MSLADLAVDGSWHHPRKPHHRRKLGERSQEERMATQTRAGREHGQTDEGMNEEEDDHRRHVVMCSTG